MSALVPTDEIEAIVGVQRHPTRHYARAVSTEQRAYILHSASCRDSRDDLRKCPFSLALDNGIDMAVWGGHQDKAMRVVITRSGRLVPNTPGVRLGS